MSISKGDRQLNQYCKETDEQKMTCKDCLKKELGYCKLDCIEPQRCEDFKHKSEWVHLPCKIGTVVYRVCKKKYDVDGYGMQWFEDWGIVTNRFDLCMLKEIGKTVFLTREKAEKALAERSKDYVQ